MLDLRSRRHRFFLITVALILSSLGSAVLAGGKPNAAVLRIASPYTLGTLHPLRFMADYDFQIISQIYEPLVTFDDNGRPVPALAASWRQTNETTWIFTLRRDVRWHGGNDVFAAPTPVRADDVAATYRLVLDPGARATFHAQLASAIKSVWAMDETRVEIATVKPYAFLLELLGHIPIVSAQAIAHYGADGLDKHPAGTGPFRFVSAGPDGTVVLARNDRYPVKSRLDGVVFRTISDKSVAAMALENGEIDVALQLAPQDVLRLASSSRIKILPAKGGSYRYVSLNQRLPLFADVRFRRAVASLIDLPAVVKAIFPLPQLGQPAWGPVPPGVPGYDPTLAAKWRHDTVAGLQILKELGWTDSDGDGFLDRTGRRLALAISAPSDPNRSKLALIIADQLRRAGIDASVKIKEWGLHLQDLKDGRAEMAVMGGGSTPDGLLYLFHGGFVTPDHDTGYRNQILDAALDRAVAAKDVQSREALWREAQRIAVEDRVHVAGYYEFIDAGASATVHGFSPPGFTLHLADACATVSLAR